MSKWEASDFEEKFQNLFKQTDAELVTFDNTRGVFITREDFTKYVASLAQVSSQKIGEAVGSKAKQARDRLLALENELTRVNEMLKATTRREDMLRKDLEDAEDVLNRTLEEKKDVIDTYETENKRLMKCIEAQRNVVKLLQAKPDRPGDDEIIALERAKGKKLQDELKALQKAKGEKLSEVVTLKLRVAAFKTAILEEGRHHMELRDKFEQALKDQKTLPEMVFEYSEKALRAVGLSNLLDIFAAAEKSPKAMAWDMIELAKLADPKNKLHSRSLATTVYQSVKHMKPHQRKRYISLIQDTVKAITLGSREEIEAARAIWRDEQLPSLEEKKQTKLLATTLFDAEDPLASKNPANAFVKREENPSFFDKIKMTFKKVGINTRAFFASFTAKSIWPDFSKISSKIKIRMPTKAKILIGMSTFRMRQSARHGWNKAILNYVERNPNSKVLYAPWTPLQSSGLWCYAESTGLSYGTVVRTVPAIDYEYRLSDSEWEVLRPFMKTSDIEADVKVLDAWKTNGDFVKRNNQLVNFYKLK